MLFYLLCFVAIGIVIGLVDRKKEYGFGIPLIVIISVLWGFAFGIWAILTFVELLIGYLLVNKSARNKIDNEVERIVKEHQSSINKRLEGISREGVSLEETYNRIRRSPNESFENLNVAPKEKNITSEYLKK